LRLQVSELLREAIASGEYAPGDRLIERELCERYAVSRTVIREALRHLEAEELVTMVPNKGPEVARMSRHDIEDLYEVRAVMEALAGSLCALRSGPEVVEALVAAVNRIEEALTGGRMKEALAAKDDFYRALLDGADNGFVTTTLRGLHVRIQMLRNLSLSAPGRGVQTVAELREIVAAVEANDGPRAWDACCAHVRAAADVAFRQLDAQSLSAPDDGGPRGVDVVPMRVVERPGMTLRGLAGSPLPGGGER
jgi:DNA-binding GntR family transcriptional regulator